MMARQSMERARQLMTFWQYLPAFRIAAELEHLRKAAEVLHISPSALSRSIAMLEEGLGTKLFERHGRQLRLNEKGRTMLESVRTAMRIVDEGMEHTRERESVGPLRVQAPPYLLGLVADALVELLRECPELVPHLTSHGDADITALLKRGDLDLALTSRSRTSSATDCVPIGSLARSVYASPSHPIFRGLSGMYRSKGDARFALLRTDAEDDTLLRLLGMPEVSFRTDDIATVIAVCRRAELLTVLPDRAVENESELRRLPEPVLAPVPLFAMRRKHLAENDLLERVRAAIAARLS